MEQEQDKIWVVAVSGGIDSMVLLDLLYRRADRRLVVAHADHGIRPDSREDAEFVCRAALEKGLTFVSKRLRLGPHASEALARRKRYEWLESVRVAYQASAIVTAHHQDDIIETMIMNVRRGTGWRGVASLRSGGRLLRPLLTKSKAEITTYALRHGVQWRDDSTNDDLRYLRNAIRHGIVPRLTSEQRRQLVELYWAQVALRDELEAELSSIYEQACSETGLSRYWLTMTPRDVAHELLQYHLGARLERPHAERLLIFARTGRDGAVHTLPGGQSARVTTDELIV